MDSCQIVLCYVRSSEYFCFPPAFALSSTLHYTYLRMPKLTRTSVRGDDRRMDDVNLDDFWNADADKYKCCCRTFHVVRASLFIAYAQMLITFVFALFFTFYYIQAINGRLMQDHWINQLASLLFAVTLQLLLVLLLVHGIRTERRSFLLPFIVFSLIAVLLGFIQVVRHIGEQLSTTQMAFHYDDIPHEYITMSQPPPYADTVISIDKEPLTT
uniref:Uncharacterized protein n=1 Tax=Wuchereria bancrofti TaxID=6293 RepID=A0A1I8EUD9_WUCBA